jgi:dipeptidyl-peptidase 4
LAQDKQKITLEWIHSNKPREFTALPSYFWLNNGKLILFDSRKPINERTFELFDPKSGKTTKLLDSEKALNSLQKLVGERTVSSIRWPSAFDESGQKAFYIIQGDIFVLDINNSEFVQITTTEETEKSANFSPDGQKIAFVRSNDLFVYNLVTKTETRITFDGSETVLNGTLSWVYWEEIFGRRDIGYWWSGDSKRIAYLKSDESLIPITHFVDFKPTYPRVIEQRYPKAGGKNPIVHLHMADLGNQERTFFNPIETTYEYIIRANWLPDNNRVCIQTLNRDQTKLDYYFVDSRTGENTHILADKDDAWISMTDDLYFLNDGKHFLITSERDGYTHLYRYTLDGKLVNQITKGNWNLRSSGGVFWVNQSVQAIDEKNETVYFTALEKSSVERHLYQIKFDGSGMKRLSKEDGTHGISFSPNAKFYLDTYSNIFSLPTLKLYKNNGTFKQVLAEANSELFVKYDIQIPEMFTVSTRDNFKMPATLLKPNDFDQTKKYPVLINVYGGPSAPTIVNSWRSSIFLDQVLLENGYLVFRVDNRSATGISKELTTDILYGTSKDTKLNDLLDAVKWLKSQPYIDGNRFGIWGWSGGGVFTLLAMTGSSEFKAGIAGAPVTDRRFYDTKWTEFSMRRPQDNPEGFERVSLLKQAKNLHGRLMIMHGTYDDNVHPQNSWALIDELINAGITFDMQFYPMRKHGFGDRSARFHRDKTMIEFWNRSL